MTKIFKNCTPHTVNMVDDNQKLVLSIPKGDVVPRLAQSTEEVGDVCGIPLTATVFGEVQGLPDSEEGVYFIVSRLVMTACPNRKDLVVPNEVVRDADGNIIGCRSFAIN